MIKTSNTKHKISHKLTIKISQNIPLDDHQRRAQQSPLRHPSFDGQKMWIDVDLCFKFAIYHNPGETENLSTSKLSGVLSGNIEFDPNFTSFRALLQFFLTFWDFSNILFSLRFIVAIEYFKKSKIK